MVFENLGLIPELLESIEYMGFSETTPIQEKAIPVIMAGKDLIASAQTGTGKTAAFLLPVMNDICRKRPEHTHTLILVPTRELAIQIDQQILGLAYTLNITSIAVYGGGDGSGWEQEKVALSKGADMIVATPGRLISHLTQGYVRFDKIEMLVLDEADRMLDIGFYDDIMLIISHIPAARQTLMFSATIPYRIRSLSKKIMKNPVEISLEMSKPADGVIQSVYHLDESQKIPLINTLLGENPDHQSVLIFTSTKKKVSDVVRGLRSGKYLVEGISSALEQNEREEMLIRFRSRQCRVLVATDVLSRGIDVKDINMVINYDVPSDAEDYVHRVGRTARAEKTGIAVTLINRLDQTKMQRIEKLIGYKVNIVSLPDSVAGAIVKNRGSRSSVSDSAGEKPGNRKYHKNRSRGEWNKNSPNRKFINKT
ncbi:MAG: DEAD/DEAH box helicase [Bacteroidales bacterium]|jgi:superfamily II DNA/RNA helicase|nr:DEAD/DEAH box helicase [Bacteroidales bacterium]